MIGNFTMVISFSPCNKYGLKNGNKREKENVIIQPTSFYENKRVSYGDIPNKSRRRMKIRVIWFLLLIMFSSMVVILFFLIQTPQIDFIFQKQKLNYRKQNSSSTGIYVTDVSEIVEEAMPFMVAITSKSLIGGTYSGSGIIIGKNSAELMILTNYHVIEQAVELFAKFVNQKEFTVTVKGVSKEYDLAVLVISIGELDQDTLHSIKVAPIGYSRDLKVGSGVIAIGNVLGYGQSVTTGIISAVDQEVVMDEHSYKMIQTDAAINFGNSGGALLNSKGEVIGINSFKFSPDEYSSVRVEGIGLAIPITDVSGIITKLMNGEN